MVRNLFIVVVTTILLAACSSAPKGVATPLGLVSASPKGDGAPVESVISAVFDSRLRETTQQDITVRSGGKLVAGSLAYDAATFTLTFTPAAKLDYGASYTVELSDALMNEAGLGLASSHGWSFATVAAPITEPTEPSNPSNPTEPTEPTDPVDPTDPTNPVDPTEPTSPDADGDGVADEHDNAPHHYNPDQADSDGDGIADVIDNAPYVYNPGQEDSDGDGVADVIDNAPNFYNPSQETVNPSNPSDPSHIVAPIVIATDPSNNETNVDIDGIITAGFNVALDEATLTASSFTLAANGQLVPGIVDYDPDTNSAVFGSLLALEYNTTYTATLKASIKSAAGVGMAQDLVWSFSTAADASSVVPAPGNVSGFKIIARSPNSREAGVSPSTSITVEFSKPLDPATLTAKTFKLKRAKGGFVKGTVSYSEVTDTAGVTHYLATFKPNAPLAAGINYRVRVDGSISDTSGNTLGSTSQWFFATAN